jgi:hypothetical protein
LKYEATIASTGWLRLPCGVGYEKRCAFGKYGCFARFSAGLFYFGETV